MHQLHQIGLIFGFPRIVEKNAKSPDIRAQIPNVAQLLWRSSAAGASTANTITGSWFSAKCTTRTLSTIRQSPSFSSRATVPSKTSYVSLAALICPNCNVMELVGAFAFFYF